MKKKFLRSLGALEKWLKEREVLDAPLAEALNSIKIAVNSLEEEIAEAGPLPPPAEIADDPQAIALYSDGGCRGNPGPGAFAYVLQEHGGEVLGEGAEFESMTTNNKMELMGPLEGLQELSQLLPLRGRDPLLTRVKVVTDSNYVVQGMKSWVDGWKARGWKKADNKTPENLELWQALDQVRTKFMQVDWMWIKGHAGHPQNEHCDRRANELMDENQST